MKNEAGDFWYTEKNLSGARYNVATYPQSSDELHLLMFYLYLSILLTQIDVL